MDPYKDRGCTLSIEYWYTILRLAMYLLQIWTKVAGTVRPCRTIFLRSFQEQSYAESNNLFKENEHILAIKYRGAMHNTVGKPNIVHIISTRHSARMVNTAIVDAQGNTFKKPNTTVY